VRLNIPLYMQTTLRTKTQTGPEETWLSNRSSIKGSKLLFPVIKANQIKFISDTTRFGGATTCYRLLQPHLDFSGEKTRYERRQVAVRACSL